MTSHIGKRKAKVQFSLRLRRIVLLGTPLAITALLFFHPSPYDDVAGKLMPVAGWWIALHTIGFLLFALMGVALWLLTAGLRGVFATVSRVAAVVFALFYDAGDAIAGISTGILARSAEAQAHSESRPLLELYKPFGRTPSRPYCSTSAETPLSWRW